MVTFEGIEENFRFIVIEVQNQVEAAFRYLTSPDEDDSLRRRIIEKDDYIDNLKTIIENKCFTLIHRERGLARREVDRIRSIHIICVNLERIADFCVNMVRQVEHLRERDFLGCFSYSEFFTQAIDSLSRLLPAFQRGNLAGALSICKSEAILDRLYKENFDRVMAKLRRGDCVEDLITILFIYRYLERVGDSLLNIGEAILFVILGEKIKIERWDALRQTLEDAGLAETLSQGDFEAVWGTRSGCNIGVVGSRTLRGGDGENTPKIYKEGMVQKIEAERDSLLRWNGFLPGLAATVYNFRRSEDKAALLVEFLPGRTLDEVILTADDRTLSTALTRLQQILRIVWENSKKKEDVATDFVEQIKSRLNAVTSIHPRFSRPSFSVGSAAAPSTGELLERLKRLEAGLSAPFSVFIHGDCNINNLLYNEETEAVHFIDLYRSRQYDYVQDVSVFLVSNFRIPLFDTILRKRLDRIITGFYRFAATFAQRNADPTFGARLALGLARSFYTSTRFEQNAAFARNMFLRSHFLLERLLAHSGPWEDFSLPETILHY